MARRKIAKRCIVFLHFDDALERVLCGLRLALCALDGAPFVLSEVIGASGEGKRAEKPPSRHFEPSGI